MIKGSIQEEDRTIVNTYTPNRSTWIHKANANSHKRRIDSNKIIVGDFNTPLTPMDRSSRQKISKETQALNDTLDQMDLFDIYRAFHPKAAEHTFFSSVHGTFSRTDHILGHKSSLGKFKKTEIISIILSNYEIRNKLQGKNRKNHKHMAAKQCY